MDHYGSTTDNVVHPWYTRNSGSDNYTDIRLRRCTGPLNGCTGWEHLVTIDCGPGSGVGGCGHLHITWQMSVSECRAYMLNEVYNLWQYSHAHHYWCG